MAHDTIDDVGGVIAIQDGAVVSKVVHRDEELDVTVFGFDVGQGLTEHTATRTAIVQVLRGRLAMTIDGERRTAVPGTWICMAASAPHDLTAEEPTVMLLTLIRPTAGGSPD